MGNGNRSGTGLEGSSLDCDVGLGLKMQNTESYPHLPYHHHQQQHPDDSSSFSGGYGGRGGPFCFGTYDAVGAAGSASGASVFQRTLHPDTTFKSSGKILFTAAQWQELERQTMIYKYMMASVPVPPELLIPITKTPLHGPVSQSNTRVLDLRFSSGSDPEPWRCRRTDGKKWRCSRDVAPEQKYCERHAHKTRTRSRKPVENQTQNTTTTTTKANNNYTRQSPILPAYTTTDPFQKPVSQFPNSASATSLDQARCIEWFMKGGTNNTLPLSTSNQQWHHQQSSSRIGFKRDSTDHTKNAPFFLQYEDEQTPVNFNPYLNDSITSPRFESHQLTDCSLLNPNADDTTHTTRRFIDAWSSGETEDLNSVGNKCSVSSARKLPLSSLTLSMSGADGVDDDNGNAQFGVEMMEGDRGLLKSHWLNPALWMGSPPPGGPLGEALCLGMASNAKAAASNVPSPHGYSNSNSTSSCSKSSCDDGGQGLNFH